MRRHFPVKMQLRQQQNTIMRASRRVLHPCEHTVACSYTAKGSACIMLFCTLAQAPPVIDTGCLQGVGQCSTCNVGHNRPVPGNTFSTLAGCCVVLGYVTSSHAGSCPVMLCDADGRRPAKTAGRPQLLSADGAAADPGAARVQSSAASGLCVPAQQAPAGTDEV